MNYHSIPLYMLIVLFLTYYLKTKVNLNVPKSINQNFLFKYLLTKEGMKNSLQ